MFLHLSIILFKGGVCISACIGADTPIGPTPPWADTPIGQTPPHPSRHPWQTPPGRHLPWQTPPGQISPRQTPPSPSKDPLPADASYWNAFLFSLLFFFHSVKLTSHLESTSNFSISATPRNRQIWVRILRSF